MSFFNKEKIETSNDYYEAYKAQIATRDNSNKGYTISSFLKFEVTAIAIALFLMNYNNISLKLTTQNNNLSNSLPVSIQANNQEDLVVELEESIEVAQLDIKEDDFEEILDSEVAENTIYTENAEMKLLIELLKSEINEKDSDKTSNRIIISQK